jgi:hypothetical protein
MGGFFGEMGKKPIWRWGRMLNEGKLIPDDMFFFAMKGLLEEKIGSGQALFLKASPDG